MHTEAVFVVNSGELLYEEDGEGLNEGVEEFNGEN